MEESDEDSSYDDVNDNPKSSKRQKRDEDEKPEKATSNKNPSAQNDGQSRAEPGTPQSGEEIEYKPGEFQAEEQEEAKQA